MNTYSRNMLNKPIYDLSFGLTNIQWWLIINAVFLTVMIIYKNYLIWKYKRQISTTRTVYDYFELYYSHQYNIRLLNRITIQSMIIMNVIFAIYI